MLNIEEIKLKQNLVIIEEHPVEVEETVGGVLKPEEQIAQEKAKRLVRTGVVIASGQIGELTNSTLPSSLTKGKHLTPEELIGTVVIYPANAVDFVFDIPLKDTKRPIVLSIDYILGTLEEVAPTE